MQFLALSGSQRALSKIGQKRIQIIHSYTPVQNFNKIEAFYHTLMPFTHTQTDRQTHTQTPDDTISSLLGASHPSELKNQYFCAAFFSKGPPGNDKHYFILQNPFAPRGPALHPVFYFFFKIWKFLKKSRTLDPSGAAPGAPSPMRFFLFFG